MNINYILISVLIGNEITVKGHDEFTVKELEETLSILDRILKCTKAIGDIEFSNLCCVIYIYIYIFLV